MKDKRRKETLKDSMTEQTNSAPPSAKIAYLAPELPALSATFVYNEIQGLEELGMIIVPLSVHQPVAVAQEDQAQQLAQRTVYLYGCSRRQLIVLHLTMLALAPWRYTKTLLTALRDMFRVGPFSRTGLGLLYRFSISVYLANILKQEGCVHLHVHFAHIPTDLAMYASGLSQVPFSFTAHANDIFERGWLLKHKMQRALFVVTISDYNRRFLSRFGTDIQKVHVIRCGVRLSRFTTRPYRPMQTPVRLGVLGRMVEKKGLDDLLAACRILKNRGLDFHLDMVGDGPLYEQLAAQTATLELDGQVTFKGAMAHQSVPMWMQELDLFVLPCKKDAQGDQDGIPVVLMEAMLTGIPVVSTRLSGIPELVQDGFTGCLASPNQPAALAEAILRICRDDVLCKRLCLQAADLVRDRFNLADNVHRLSTLFKEKNHALSQQTLCDHIPGS